MNIGKKTFPRFEIHVLKKPSGVIERSRSGNGAHAWIFFVEKVPASMARRLGSALLTLTMSKTP